MEEWRPIPGWEDLYQASSQGRIRSLARIDSIGRHIQGRIRKLTPNEKGYLTVDLYRNGVEARRKVHALVCAAFHGARPEGDIVTRHLDGDHLNNVPKNLTWGTRSENNLDRYRRANERKAVQNG